MNKVAFLIGVILLGVAAISYTYFSPQSNPINSTVHNHADYKLYLLNKQFNFSQQKYASESDQGCAIGEEIAHLHDMDGDVVHVHAKNATWGLFFKLLGMNLNDSCFTDDLNHSYCSNGNYRLRFYLNEVETSNLPEQGILDLSKVLITYGNSSEQEVSRQLSAITDKAKDESKGLTC